MVELPDEHAAKLLSGDLKKRFGDQILLTP